MNSTEESRGPAWQLTRHVFLGQIAIVELSHAVHPLRCRRIAKRGPRRSAGGTTNMENRETRRKIIRQWASLPKDKRQTADQAAEFAKKAIEQAELQPSR